LRRTRIDAFEEQWWPTGHYLNMSSLAAAGYRTIELQAFKEKMLPSNLGAEPQRGGDDAGAGSSSSAVGDAWRRGLLRLPRLHTRSLAKAAPRLQFFDDFGITFGQHRFQEFPFAFVQQSAARWVDGSSPEHHGRYTMWREGEIESWWQCGTHICYAVMRSDDITA
jgi:hypothetical protein